MLPKVHLSGVAKPPDGSDWHQTVLGSPGPAGKHQRCGAVGDGGGVAGGDPSCAVGQSVVSTSAVLG